MSLQQQEHEVTVGGDVDFSLRVDEVVDRATVPF